MKLNIFENDLRLKYPFTISRHTYQSQPNVVIALQLGAWIGYGEATVNPYYRITIANLKESFRAMKIRLETYHFTTPDQLWEDFSDFLPINSFALSALNNAGWDLFGKMNNRPVSSLIDSVTESKIPMTSYTLGIADKVKMIEKMHDFPWPVYKIKLGTPDDLGLVQYLRKHTDAIIRVDANCAWNAFETMKLSREFQQLNVEFIEQPLLANDPEQQDCFSKSSLPLIADESCCVESDVANCQGKFHGINIKLLKCGGITPALRMVQKAREKGLKTMVGCMSETSIGISAAAQLLPLVDFADLDGPLLLAEDLASGVNYADGYLQLSGGNGLGVTLSGIEASAI